MQTNSLRVTPRVDGSSKVRTVKIDTISTTKEEEKEIGKTETLGANGISKVETEVISKVGTKGISKAETKGISKVETRVISKLEVQEATERSFAGNVEDLIILPGIATQQL